MIYALFTWPSFFRHHRGIWWIDNTAALITLLKGTSSNPDLAQMAQLNHATLFSLQSSANPTALTPSAGLAPRAHGTRPTGLKWEQHTVRSKSGISPFRLCFA